MAAMIAFLAFNPIGIQNGDTTWGAVGLIALVAFVLFSRGR